MNQKNLKSNHNIDTFNWKCLNTWKKSAKNTFWCLVGCSIGDFGTIYFFQFYEIDWLAINIMILAIINGLITSILFEVITLLKQMTFYQAIKTALGMSFISMLAMEISMNAFDLIIFKAPIIVLWFIPVLLFVGFITAWPYNYWLLKKYNVSCH